MYHMYKDVEDFVGMDMCRKFLEMGFTREDDMQIIKMVKSMMRIETSNLKNQMHLHLIKQGLQRYLNTSEMLLRMTLYIRR